MFAVLVSLDGSESQGGAFVWEGPDGANEYRKNFTAHILWKKTPRIRSYRAYRK